MSANQRKNQEAESRRLDYDSIEQRALQIARLDGRSENTEDDRDAAKEELLSPNEPLSDAPEVSPETSAITAWDEAPGSSGHQVERVKPEDEASIGKELFEKGLRGPQVDSPS